jgi:hypothetical protein
MSSSDHVYEVRAYVSGGVGHIVIRIGASSQSSASLAVQAMYAGVKVQVNSVTTIR